MIKVNIIFRQELLIFCLSSVSGLLSPGALCAFSKRLYKSPRIFPKTFWDSADQAVGAVPCRSVVGRALVTVCQSETVNAVPDTGQRQKDLPTDEWQEEEEVAFSLLTLWLTHLWELGCCLHCWDAVDFSFLCSVFLSLASALQVLFLFCLTSLSKCHLVYMAERYNYKTVRRFYPLPHFSFFHCQAWFLIWEILLRRGYFFLSVFFYKMCSHIFHFKYGLACTFQPHLLWSTTLTSLRGHSPDSNAVWEL